MENNSLPLIHVYPHLSPGENVQILTNSLGLRELVYVAIEALYPMGKQGEVTVCCRDRENYKLEVIREDCDEIWQLAELPYKAILKKLN